MPKVRLQGAHALITGASSGIGAATARELARAGCRVSLAARRRERLEELSDEIRVAGGTAEVFPVDLAAAGTAVTLAHDVVREAGPVDILLNNAGVSGGVSFFVEKPAEEIETTLQVNLVAPITLARALLPGMVERRRGALVSVSSGFGLLPMPNSSTYCATKAALAMLDEVLRMETAGSGVHVLSVFPGPVDTEMLRATKAASRTSAQMSRMPTGDPKTCARRIRRCLETGEETLFYPAVYGSVRPLAPILTRVLRAASPAYNRARARGRRKSKD